MTKINILSKGFESSNLSVVSNLIFDITNDMEKNSGHLEVPSFNIRKSPFGHPRFEGYKNNTGTFFNVFIEPCNGDILEWIGQFSHEYTHLILAHSGKRVLHDRLKWLEESLCHISTLYQMDRLCRNPEILGFRPEAEWATRGLNTILPLWTETETPLKIHLLKGLGVLDYQDLLQEDNPSFPALYASIAAVLFPLFQGSPNLWRILRHIQDCDEAQDLKDVLFYCRERADESYLRNLDGMIIVLLGMNNVNWKFAD